MISILPASSGAINVIHIHDHPMEPEVGILPGGNSISSPIDIFNGRIPKKAGQLKKTLYSICLTSAAGCRLRLSDVARRIQG